MWWLHVRQTPGDVTNYGATRRRCHAIQKTSVLLIHSKIYQMPDDQEVYGMIPYGNVPWLSVSVNQEISAAWDHQIT